MGPELIKEVMAEDSTVTTEAPFSVAEPIPSVVILRYGVSSWASGNSSWKTKSDMASALGQ